MKPNVLINLGPIKKKCIRPCLSMTSCPETVGHKILNVVPLHQFRYVNNCIACAWVILDIFWKSRVSGHLHGVSHEIIQKQMLMSSLGIILNWCGEWSSQLSSLKFGDKKLQQFFLINFFFELIYYILMSNGRFSLA